MSWTKSESDYERVRDHLVALLDADGASLSRLPPERDLAERLSVGRSVVRRAFGALEEQGLIHRHVGRGTFVGPARPAPDHDGMAVDVSQAGTPVSLGERTMASGAHSPADYIETRLRFEPELSWMIVARASAADFDLLRHHIERSEAAPTMAEFEICDSDFHAALVNATHNSLTIALYRQIDEVRRAEHANWTRTHGAAQDEDRRAVFIREHRQILTCLMNRDARGAREAWGQHLRNTRRRINDF